MAQNVTYNQAYRIITKAMQNACILAEGETPSGESLADYLNTLNDMINARACTSQKLWVNEDVPVTLVQGTNMYSFTTGGQSVANGAPAEVVDAYYADVNGVRRPLIVLARTDWDRLSQTNQQGPINSYFVDPQLASLNVYVWEVPDATTAQGTLHIVLKRQITNVYALTDTMTFPLQWMMALSWGLAAEICNGQPDAVVARCEQKAAFYWDMAENYDVEKAPTYFIPDARGLYNHAR